MLSNFKARICRWNQLAHADFCNILRWAGYPIRNAPANALVCSASRNGETVAFMTAEPVFIVTNFSIKPDATLQDAQQAGDVVDNSLAIEAKRAGVERFLIALPDGIPPQPDEKSFRYIERKIPATQQQHEKLSARLPDGINPITTVAWIN